MSERNPSDKCPGVLRPFVADDGAIVRLRIPGGRITPTALLEVAHLAAEFGAPFVQLTSRGNLQLRGLPVELPAAFVERVEALGLLPSDTHDRVRNIVASPAPFLDELVAGLDAELQRRPELHALSGRWMFGLSVATETRSMIPTDVCYQRDSATHGILVVGGREWPCAPDSAVAVMLDVAEAFVNTVTDDAIWNVTDLAPGHPFFARIDGLLNGGSVSRPSSAVSPSASSTERAQVAESVLREFHVPLGLLDVDMARAISDACADVVVTPHRSIVVRRTRLQPAAVDEALTTAGLVTDPMSAQVRFTACIGAPYCRRTSARTIPLTRSAARVLDSDRPTERGLQVERTHVVGCERACGRPAAPHALVIDPGSTHDILEPNEIHA